MSSEPAAVFTIPAHVPFVDALAAGITHDHASTDDPLALARVLVLLPTRRACRALQDAFLRQSGGRALLLPRMVPIGDVDEDALQFDLLAMQTPDTERDIPPAIGDMRRRLMLARLVQDSAAQTGEGQLPVDQAVRLASELSNLLDQVQTERLGFERLSGLVPEDYAEHWRLTLQFLEVLTGAWPECLAAEGVIDSAERRNILLAARAEHWQRNPPPTPVIAAGSTGSIPATADLLAVVSRLPLGAVVLPGLDHDLDEAIWDLLEPSHPQFGLKHLLTRLGLTRSDVADWPGMPLADRPQRARSKLISAALRPALATDSWAEIDDIDRSALTGITRLDCASSDEEAGAIALIMRNVLTDRETGRTAALVTPDRDLARRVAGALARWDVTVDDSGGVPLAETPPGVFFRLIVDLIGQDAAPFPLLSALKHPLAAGGIAPGVFRGLVRALEIAVLRGPRLAPGLPALAEAVRRAAETREDQDPELRTAADMIDALVDNAQPFSELLAGPAGPIGEIIDAHARFAEALAASDEMTGAGRLWGGDAGESLAAFVTDLADAGHVLSPVSAARYPALLEALLAGRTVRPRYGSHPRLAILGPLEARLQRYDVMILGGLNEGSWPPALAADPWMSRPMRADFGLPQPERRTGLSAHDFTQAMGAAEIYLTRAKRVDGSPTVPARWLTRLEFAAKPLGLDPAEMIARGDKWLAWHRDLALATPDGVSMPDITDRGRPRPTPPVAARPRRLSVTEIETWMRDPYAIYARHILKLRALPPIDQAPDAADYGSLIHSVLDRFLSQCPAGPLPDDALARLLDTGAEMLAPIRTLPAVWTFWWPRFQRIAQWFIDTETARRATIAQTYTEVRGRLALTGPHGAFELVARADRIDRLSDGGLAIIDFKTGAVPGAAEVVAGFAPQLPLEAAMAIAGGFDEMAPGTVGGLEYWRLSGGRVVGAVSSVGGDAPDALARQAADGLAHLIETFDDPATPYESRPRANWAPRYSDYEHLARVKEWSAPGADGGEDG
ncbi:MAG: double-strand break repair protein AddB [Alphaproteobacteria bacterium]|nr:double-strand break repair protein AddB [Alphaproteobacteria bacterium]